jgi:hypothetical protein
MDALHEQDTTPFGIPLIFVCVSNAYQHPF